MKTEFKLETARGSEMVEAGSIKITGRAPKSSPYVTVTSAEGQYYFIKDQDLERFAVNILKSLKSKKLK